MSMVQVIGLSMVVTRSVVRHRWEKEHKCVAIAPFGPMGTPGFSISGRF
jgi:hypothetical protein